MAKPPTLVATKGPLKGLNVAVSLWSKVLVFSLVIYAWVWSDHAGNLFPAVNSWILSAMKWYYIGLVAALLFFVVWLMVSRFGNIRLGKDTDRPEFSYFSWFAMLFGAGMGIGTGLLVDRRADLSLPIQPLHGRGNGRNRRSGASRHAAHLLPLGLASLGTLCLRRTDALLLRLQKRTAAHDSLVALSPDRRPNLRADRTRRRHHGDHRYRLRHRNIARLGRPANRYRAQRTHRSNLLCNDPTRTLC